MRRLVALLAVGAACLAGRTGAEEPAAPSPLERRVQILEELLAAKPYVAVEDVPEATLGFLTGTEISGYASASYLYNFDDPDSGLNTGRGFDSRHDQFMANKFLLLLQKPVEADAFAWRGGYTAELILGQDAEFTQASGLDLGTDGDLLQACVVFNVPVGHGLTVGFGKYSTPIGYELAETEQNYNWSAGNQWVLLEPFTHTGVYLTYPINLQWEAQFFVNNGWDVVSDNNSAQSFIGRLAYTPREQLSYTLIGFSGAEQDLNDDDLRSGVDFVASYEWTSTFGSWSPKFITACQVDYGTEENAAVTGTEPDPEAEDAATAADIAVIDGDAEWYGAGLWLIVEPNDRWSVALRGDYVNDKDGARSSEAPATAPFAINAGQELYSATLTVNYMPAEGLKLSPEVRWDASSLDGAFDGHDRQVTLGFGAVYAF